MVHMRPCWCPEPLQAAALVRHTGKRRALPSATQERLLWITGEGTGIAQALHMYFTQFWRALPAQLCLGRCLGNICTLCWCS